MKLLLSTNSFPSSKTWGGKIPRLLHVISSFISAVIIQYRWHTPVK